jgi:hypothetical protein
MSGLQLGMSIGLCLHSACNNGTVILAAQAVRRYSSTAIITNPVRKASNKSST